jgi:hypothetical protein
MKKTQDEIIKEQIGITLNAKTLTPMDKGECKRCMTAWEKEVIGELIPHIKAHVGQSLIDFLEYLRENDYKANDMRLDEYIDEYLKSNTSVKICPYCGNMANFHNNYDYANENPYENIIDILCNECGETFNTDGTKKNQN